MSVQPEYVTEKLPNGAFEQLKKKNKLHNFIKESGFELAGKHHEIY
jgi:hypothetical protein